MVKKGCHKNVLVVNCCKVTRLTQFLKLTKPDIYCTMLGVLQSFPEDVRSCTLICQAVKLFFTSERGRCTVPPSLALLTRPNFTQNKEKKIQQNSCAHIRCSELYCRQVIPNNTQCISSWYMYLPATCTIISEILRIKQNLSCNL